MKKILVPTDFSGCSLSAVEFAAYTAKKTGSVVDLLHVIDTGIDALDPTVIALLPGSDFAAGAMPPTDAGIIMMGLLKQTKMHMNRVMHMPYWKGVTVTDHVKTGGDIYHKIIEYAQKTNPDMIIMGTHGASGFKEAFIGSNTEKVARLADRPLLAIKHKIAHPDIQTIVFATDFSDEVYEVYTSIRKFAEIFDAKIYLLKVNTPGSFESSDQTTHLVSEFIKEFREAKDYPFVIYNNGSKESGIVHFARKVDADMIALGTHGRGGLSVLFHPSVSEGLVNHSPLPVLTVNIHRKNIIMQSIPQQRKMSA